MKYDLVENIKNAVLSPNKTIKYERKFSSIEFKKIKDFNSFEDAFSPRWGAIYDNYTLYIFPVWTGNCIFSLYFSEIGETTHAVVCDNKDIYESFGDEFDRIYINDIINEMILHN